MSRRRPPGGDDVVLRLFVLARPTLVALGLWVTESRGGPETEAASFYLLAVAIGLAVLVAGGIAFMLTRRDRPRSRGRR